VLMGVLPNLFLRPIGPAVDRMLRQVRLQAPPRIQVRAASGLEPKSPERVLTSQLTVPD